MFGRTLFKLGHSYVVVVPPAFLRLLKWHQGDQLDVAVRGHEVIISNATQHGHTAQLRATHGSGDGRKAI